MKKRTGLICMLLIVFTALGGPQTAMAKEDAPVVMIVHSYDLSYQWTKKQDEGIRQTLLDVYPKANIYTEVLDAKRFDRGQIFLEELEGFVRKYKDHDLDVILATDDMGLEFALQAREKLGFDVPIAFSGVLETHVDALIGDAVNVTGVYEIRGFTRMIELMRILQPNASRIVIINDVSSSSRQMVEMVLKGFDTLNLREAYEIEHWEKKAYAEILEDVQRLDEQTAVYLISYHQSYDGVIKNGSDFCQEISELSAVPMYSLGELYFGSGLIGGEFLSGRLQGEELGHMALEILGGRPADELPYSDASTSYLGVDEAMMQKYGIEDVDLPEDTVLINHSLTFFEEYRTWVMSMLAAIAILFAFLVVLFFQYRTIRKNNETLTEQKKRLQGLYAQASASEEELMAQNKDLRFYQKKLQYEADHDFLTGLKNRSSQEKMINLYLDSDLTRDKRLIFIFLDLDNFKYINNSMGHHAGDLILKEVAKRLETLGEEYFVARIGGDEFVVAHEYRDMDTSELVGLVTTKMQKLFAVPARVGMESVPVSASMGCSFYPMDATTYDNLIIYADLAMYEAKRKRKGTMVRFNQEIEQSSDRDYRLGKEIPGGIERDEFYLAYQPILETGSESVRGIEVLLRWKSREFGLVSPGEFIHAAEVGGHMASLGARVLDMAFSFMARHKEALSSVERLSINISVSQLFEEHFTADLMERLERHGVAPHCIQLEIVESMMIHSYEIVCEKLAELKAYGISIALDDFGTGYSSLAHLNGLPIDVLKIDKQFVDDINGREEEYLIIKTIALLARSMGLETIAEGVETQVQADFVEACGITSIQGYYYSRPMSEADLLAYLQKKGAGAEPMQMQDGKAHES